MHAALCTPQCDWLKSDVSCELIDGQSSPLSELADIVADKCQVHNNLSLRVIF